MSRLARLRDCFLDGRTPHQLLFCTYGFEPEFFEGEILPAAFPDLALDRKAGTAGAYFAEADRLLPGRPIVVCCDHTTGGKRLPYNVLQVTDVTYHPKLVIADYGDTIRAVVTSANVSRAAWTGMLELFLLDDLVPGQPHGWGPALARFLRGTQGRLPPAAGGLLGPFVDRLRLISEGPAPARLITSFDGPLLHRAFASVNAVRRIEAVTPFFEGAEGDGVFEALERRFPEARGRLFVRARTAADGKLEVDGPAMKLRALVTSGRWSLRQVSPTWQGDTDDAPPRTLHGKLLALRHGQRATVVLGSANLTRAALLHEPPAGNVELSAVIEMSGQQLDAIIPDHVDLPIEDVEFVEAPVDEDIESAGPDQWIEVAVYHVSASQLEVRLVPDAPEIQLAYEDRVLGSARPEAPWRGKLELQERLEIEVRAGDQTAVVPFLILDLARWEPRGAAQGLGFEEFLDVLAGARDLDGDVAATLDLAYGANDLDGGDALGGGGTIAWRKYLRALEGLREDLLEEARFPAGVRRILIGPHGVEGLRTRIDALTSDDGPMLPADRAFALHEIRCMLRGAAVGMSDVDESRALVSEVSREVAKDFEAFRAMPGHSAALRAQLKMLAAEAR